MPDTLTFTFDWQARDHIMVSRLLTREMFATGWPRVGKWLFVALIVALGLGAILLVIQGNYPTAISAAPWIVLMVFWLFFFDRIAPWLQARRFRRHDPNAAYPFTHTLGPDGLGVSTHTADLALKWAGLVKVRETPDLFMFYYNKRCAYYLPKRAISGGESGLEALRSWVRSHISADTPYVRD
jgi:hypothetical protein